jgi:hypothetical protein
MKHLKIDECFFDEDDTRNDEPYLIDTPNIQFDSIEVILLLPFDGDEEEDMSVLYLHVDNEKGVNYYVVHTSKQAGLTTTELKDKLWFHVKCQSLKSFTVEYAIA